MGADFYTIVIYGAKKEAPKSDIVLKDCCEGNTYHKFCPKCGTEIILDDFDVEEAYSGLQYTNLKEDGSEFIVGLRTHCISDSDSFKPEKLQYLTKEAEARVEEQVGEECSYFVLMDVSY